MPCRILKPFTDILTHQFTNAIYVPKADSAYTSTTPPQIMERLTHRAGQIRPYRCDFGA